HKDTHTHTHTQRHIHTLIKTDTHTHTHTHTRTHIHTQNCVTASLFSAAEPHFKVQREWPRTAHCLSLPLHILCITVTHTSSKRCCLFHAHLRLATATMATEPETRLTATSSLTLSHTFEHLTVQLLT